VTHFNKYFDKEYLGHWDLTEGKDATVTIEKVEAGELHKPGAKKGDKRPLLTLRGTDKKMVVNATNAKAIANLYGAHVEEWIGKRIALYRTTTNGPGGNTVECIRVRPQAPQQKTKRDESTETPSEESPS
jgi:hypothetical protein